MNGLPPLALEEGHCARRERPICAPVEGPGVCEGGRADDDACSRRGLVRVVDVGREASHARRRMGPPGGGKRWWLTSRQEEKGLKKEGEVKRRRDGKEFPATPELTPLR